MRRLTAALPERNAARMQLLGAWLAESQVSFYTDKFWWNSL